MNKNETPQSYNPTLIVKKKFAKNNHFANSITEQDDTIIFNQKSTYFFRVNNDAMCNAGVYNGDIVIVDRSIAAKNGNVIIALLKNSMIIRQFTKINNRITLVADSNKLSPIHIENGYEDFSVWGVVIYVVRSL